MIAKGIMMLFALASVDPGRPTRPTRGATWLRQNNGWREVEWPSQCLERKTASWVGAAGLIFSGRLPGARILPFPDDMHVANHLRGARSARRRHHDALRLEGRPWRESGLPASWRAVARKRPKAPPQRQSTNADARAFPPCRRCGMWASETPTTSAPTFAKACPWPPSI